MTRLKEQKIFDIITSALESVLGLDGKTLVPSKQYLQFILVKMIGGSKNPPFKKCLPRRALLTSTVETDNNKFMG